MAHEVFISYASGEHAIAAKLCARLEDEGLRCWMAPRDIAPGADWQQVLVTAIKESAALVLILSNAANQSVQVPREVERAVDARVPIVPFRIEAVKPSGPLEFSLASVHWLDAFAGTPEQHAPALIARVRELIEGSDAARQGAEARRQAAIAAKRERRRRELRAAAVVAAAAALLATAAIAVAGDSAVLQSLEHKTLDWRFAAAPKQPPTDRIVIVSLDDASLQANATALTARADEAGRLVSGIFDAGARAVAIDLLLPAAWSQSQPFADMVLRHHEKLTLAALANPDGTIVGPECLSGLVTATLGPVAAGRLFGLVNLPADGDGVVRRLPFSFPDAGGQSRPSWSALASGQSRELATAGPDMATAVIDYRVDTSRLRRLSWKDAGMFVASGDDVFRDRIVLIGAEFAGSGDTHPTPLPSTSETGLVVQSLAVNTLMTDEPIRPAGRAVSLAVTVSASLLAAFLFLAWRSAWSAVAAIAGAALLLTAWAFFLFLSRGRVAPIAAPLLTACLAVASAAFGRRWVARS